MRRFPVLRARIAEALFAGPDPEFVAQPQVWEHPLEQNKQASDEAAAPAWVGQQATGFAVELAARRLEKSEVDQRR